jgi:hypothetical protein
MVDITPPTTKTEIQYNCGQLEGFNMLRDDIMKLIPIQLPLYNHLAGDLLPIYLQNRPTIENDELYNWDELTWHNTILRTVQSLSNSPKHLEHDCWFSNFKIGNDNYPTFKVTPLVIEKRGNQGTRLFQRNGAQNSVVKLYKVLHALNHPEELEVLQERDHNSQTSHRCKNKPQLCWNCYHTVTKNDVENKEMNHCWNGCAAYCPHNPKCIFTDEFGYWIPCRNLDTIQLCTHAIDCHKVKITN